MKNLGPLATDSACELNVLGHDGNTLGVDGAQVGVFKKTNEVGLAGLLQCHNGRGLESEISLEILCNLSDEALEGQLADKELGALLVTSDLSEGNGSRPVSVGFLHAPCGRCTLSGSLGGELLTWSFASSAFTGSLLRSGHF